MRVDLLEGRLANPILQKKPKGASPVQPTRRSKSWANCLALANWSAWLENARFD